MSMEDGQNDNRKEMSGREKENTLYVSKRESKWGW